MSVIRSARRTGMTLVEILIGTTLLVGGGGALLFGVHYAMINASFLRQAQVAMNAAQGRLEQLVATDFNTLWTDASFAAARSTRALLAANRFDLNGDGDTVDLTDGWLAVQIRSVPLGAVPNAPSVTLLDLHVAACWIQRGRTIGEGGTFSGGTPRCQDTGADANWWVDSPVMVSTRVARRS